MAYIDKYGVEFSDDRKTLVRCPKEFKGGYAVPEGVTSICNFAFSDCTGLTSITIPKSVTSIRVFTFSGCTGLTSIVVDNDNPNFCSIDGILFNKTKTKIFLYPKGRKGAYKIPESVTCIGNSTTSGGSDLTSINVSPRVHNISYNVFSYCSGLTSITIPAGVTSIDKNDFSGCSGLTSIIVAPGNSKFDSRDNCNAIIDTENNEIIVGCQNTNIPNSVTSIGDSAFSACTSLTFISIPDSVTSIGKGAFYNCTGLTSISIPNSVTNIGSGAFRECSGLTSISIPNSVTSIGDYAFSHCTVLTSIIIPDSVTSIGEGAFSRCTGLTYISIPKSVTSIEDYAFSRCTGLTSIVVDNDNPNFCSIDGILFNKTKAKIFLYPKGRKGAYEIPESVTCIGDYAFSDCTGLTSISIPNSVTSIGDRAFSDCTGLTSISIPNSVTSIGKWAFSDCTGLTSIMVPLGQEERFCQMEGLKEYADIIRKTSEKRRQHEDEEQRRLQEQQMQEMLQGSTLFFDTETTGTPSNYKAPVTDSSNWPRLVQLAWIIADKNGNVVKKKSAIIKPDGFTIPYDASAIHGITTERALREGKPLKEVLDEFTTDLSFASQIVGHNIDFDQHIVGAELYRLNMDYSALMYKSSTCTMKSSTDFCAIPNPNTYFGGYKWPSLQELYCKLFGRDFADAHDALADITATKDCFFELKRRGVI